MLLLSALAWQELSDTLLCLCSRMYACVRVCVSTMQCETSPTSGYCNQCIVPIADGCQILSGLHKATIVNSGQQRWEGNGNAWKAKGPGS